MHFTKDNFITIQGFMALPEDMGGMGLKGNELLVYAIIYGFSQDGKSWFEGTQRYLAEWVGGTIRGIQKNLASLIEKNYVVKEEVEIHGITVYRYRVSNNSLLFQSSPPTNRVRPPHEQSSHYIYKDNISPSDIDSNESISSPPKGKSSKAFVPPAEDEVRAYCLERNNGIDPQSFIDYYEAQGWLLKNGRKMVDWKAAVRNWENRRKEEVKSAKPKEGYRRA